MPPHALITKHTWRVLYITRFLIKLLHSKDTVENFLSLKMVKKLEKYFFIIFFYYIIYGQLCIIDL